MKKRTVYSTSLDAELMKKIKILAAQLEKHQNDLIEEAIQGFIRKYKNQKPSLGFTDTP